MICRPISTPPATNGILGSACGAMKPLAAVRVRARGISIRWSTGRNAQRKTLLELPPFGQSNVRKMNESHRLNKRHSRLRRLIKQAAHRERLKVGLLAFISELSMLVVNEEDPQKIAAGKEQLELRRREIDMAHFSRLKQNRLNQLIQEFGS
jgi:hypothetical protein